jgi:hypothetical protein
VVGRSAARTVRHVSGAEATFYPYHNEEDWMASESAICSNPSLYPDGAAEFATRAKQIAIKRGMKYHRP